MNNLELIAIEKLLALLRTTHLRLVHEFDRREFEWDFIKSDVNKAIEIAEAIKNPKEIK